MMEIVWKINYSDYMSLDSDDRAELKSIFRFSGEDKSWHSEVNSAALQFLEKHQLGNARRLLSEIALEQNQRLNIFENTYSQIENRYSFLYDFQKRVVCESLVNYEMGSHGVNLWQEVGIGKTIQALCILDYLFWKKKIDKVIIACPLSLHQQWLSESKKFGLDFDIDIISGPKAKRKKYWKSKSKIKLISYESLRNDIDIIGRDWSDVLVCDEVTKAKNMKSKTYRTLKLLNTQFNILLTGTPIVNKLVDAFVENTLVDSHTYGGKMSTFNYHHAIFDTIWSPQLCRKVHIISGYRQEELFLSKIQDHSYIIKKTDVNTELPKVITEERYFDLSSGQKNILTQLHSLLNEKDATSIFQIFSLLRMLDDGIDTIMDSTSDQATELDFSNIKSERDSKLEQLLIDLDEMDSQQVLVFAHFKHTASKIAERLEKEGYDVRLLTGDTKQLDKQQIIEDFKNNKFRILIATDCISHGVSFSDVDYLVNYDLPLSVGESEQRNGRICRINSKNTKTIINYVGAVIGRRVLDILTEKFQSANELDKFKFIIGRKNGKE